ncbi:MAG TPA: nodulation protein NfeD [Gaiellaceae bacterium]|nr:nodulation protein NfeD [Gaiellaceae bacterium]
MKVSLVLAALVAVIAVPQAFTAPKAAGTPRVLAIHFVQEVDPVTQSWLNGQLDTAQRDHYSAAVIVLDTPGGDEESMRKIVQKELELSQAGTPVIVYIAPGGARGASAGVWISEAADILAMAPETNIGSSTPIDSTGANIGSDLRRKVINDAAASLRGLARSHGRNAAWADKAVRVASNLTDAEALKMHVIDLISPSLPALLNTINGRTTTPAHLKLHTAGATIVGTTPGLVTRLLSTLLNPNLVSLFFLAGVVGLGFEIFHPGVIVPGVVGAVSMIFALFGLYVLPLSWTALLLVVLGIALLLIDTHVPTHGALTIFGLVSLCFGLVTLFPANSGQTSIPLVVTLTVVLGGAWSIVVSKAVKIRHRPLAVGPQEIVGMRGVVRESGLVLVHGELWKARAPGPLTEGQRVEVESLDGLTLRVHPV